MDLKRVKRALKRNVSKALALVAVFSLLTNESSSILTKAALSESDLAGTGLSYKTVTSSDNYKNTSQYNASDPLGIATRFHLFSDGEVTIKTHTNGNMATPFLNYGSNMGTKGFADEITYIRDFNHLTSASAAITLFGSVEGEGNHVLAVGPDLEIGVEDNRYFNLSNSEKTYKVDSPTPKTLYQDTQADQFINLESEMANYKALSAAIVKATGAKAFDSVLTSDGHRGTVEIDMSSGCEVINVSAEQAQQLINFENFTIKNYKKGTASYANDSIIFNVDLSLCGTNVSFTPQIRIICTDDTVVEAAAERTSFEYGNILWNFYDSSKPDGVYTGTIATQKVMFGTILAPGAAVVTKSNIDGNIIAHNITIEAQSHRNDFLGKIPTVLVEEPTATISVLKVAEDTNKPLVGAKLELTGPNVSKTWTSTANAISFTKLKDGEYTLKEITAPVNYKKAADIRFTIEGTIVKINGVAQSDNQIVMYDEFEGVKTSIEIAKVDSSNHNLGGAKLKLTDSSNRTIEEWTSVNSGAKTISDLKPGTYTLSEVQAPNSYMLAEPITFTIGDDGKITGSLWPNNKISMVDYPKASVVISKCDAVSDMLLNGAKLKLEYKNAQTSTYTKVDEWTTGNSAKTINNLDAGEYRLTETIAPSGYEIAAPINFTIDSKGSVKINGVVQNGNMITMYDDPISATPKGTLKVIVTEKGGTPVSGIEVTITASDYNDIVKTGEDGSITIPNLVPGEYKVSIPKNNEGFCVVAENEKQDNVIADDTTIYMFELEKEIVPEKGDLEVLVIEKDSQNPVRGVSVHITGDNTDVKITTGSAGNVLKTGIPVGRYTVTIDKNVVGYVEVTNNSKTDTVKAGLKTTFTFVLEKTKADEKGKLIITVTDEKTGNTVPNAEVKVTYPDGSTKTHTTDSNGKITLTETPTGTYITEVTKVPEGYTVTTGKTDTAVVEDGKTTEKEIKIKPEGKGNLEITVIDEKTGNTVPNAEVKVTYPDGNTKTHTTDSNGKITLTETPTGTYTTEVTKVPEGYTVTTGKTDTAVVDEGKTTKKEIKITPKTETLVEGDKGDLVIIVRDEETGERVPDAEVKVTDPDGNEKIYVTDSNGEINRPDVPVGTYQIEVTDVPDGYTVTTNKKSNATVKKNQKTETIIEVDTEESEEDNTGDLEIVVQDEITGEPVPKAEVKVTYPDGKTKTYKTDEDGEILLYEVPSGKYQIEVTKVPDGYTVTVNKKTSAEVKKGKTARKVIKVKTGNTQEETPSQPNTPSTSTSTTTSTTNTSTTNKVVSSQPKTADDMNLELCFALFTISLISFVIVLLMLKRENERSY